VPVEPEHKREPACERVTGASICRADFEEATPLVVLMSIDVYHARQLFYFSSVKSTAVVAILGCILLQLKSTIFRVAILSCIYL
jgi:hypothetical protein